MPKDQLFMSAIDHLCGVNMDDLTRGDGDWRHMQPILRTTFRSLVNVINTQQSQISELKDALNNVKHMIIQKPDAEDIAALLKSREFVSETNAKIPQIIRDQMDRVNIEIVSMKTELERKASVRYVDDALGRKLDRTDVLLHSLNGKTTQPEREKNGNSTMLTKLNSDVIHFSEDLAELRSKTILLERNINDAHAKLQNVASVTDVVNTREEFLSELKAFVKTDQFKAQLTKKVDLQVFEEELLLKADAAVVRKSVGELENAVTQHERLITLLQMKPNVPVGNRSVYNSQMNQSFMPQSPVSPQRNPMNESFASAINGSFINTADLLVASTEGFPAGAGGYTHSSSHHHHSSHTAHGRTDSDEDHHHSSKRAGNHHTRSKGQTARNDSFLQSVKDGREVGFLAGLSDRVDSLFTVINTLTEDNRINCDRLSGIENQISVRTVTVAACDQLSKTVNELSCKIDRILSGVDVIPSVQECLRSLSHRIKQIEVNFGDILTPPVARNVGSYNLTDGRVVVPEFTVMQHIEDVHKLIDLLGKKVTEMSSTMSKMHVCNSTSESKLIDFDTRLLGVEGLTATVTQLEKCCQFHGSDGRSISLGDVVHDVKSLERLLKSKELEIDLIQQKLLRVENDNDKVCTDNTVINQKVNEMESKTVKIVNKLRFLVNEIGNVENRIATMIISTAAGIPTALNTPAPTRQGDVHQPYTAASGTGANTTNSSNIRANDLFSSGEQASGRTASRPPASLYSDGVSYDVDSQRDAVYSAQRYISTMSNPGGIFSADRTEGSTTVKGDPSVRYASTSYSSPYTTSTSSYETPTLEYVDRKLRELQAEKKRLQELQFATRKFDN